jgi:hypothetical protein
MTNVFLIGLEEAIAAQISRALAVERCRIEQKPRNIGLRELMDADIVFAGGEPPQYLSLLRRVREDRLTGRAVYAALTPFSISSVCALVVDFPWDHRSGHSGDDHGTYFAGGRAPGRTAWGTRIMFFLEIRANCGRV